jgi:signal transduction histidine kinase
VLPPSLELTAYRIVQEALTNARRHARGAAVDILLTYGEDEIRVRIADDGPGTRAARRAQHDSGGHGLSGMRERATLLGGRLTCGPAGPGGGFLVEAELPVRAGAKSFAEGVYE